MKTITINNLTIQFDGNDSGTPKEQAYQVIDKISDIIGRADISGAQILCAGLDNSDIDEVDNEEMEN